MTVTNMNNRFSNTNTGRQLFADQQAPAQGNTRGQQEQAEFWMNLGVPTNDPENPFVALKRGIPLQKSDLYTELKGSPAAVRRMKAENNLLTQLMNKAATLEPGEDVIIEAPGMPLAIQLRRVRGATAPEAVDDLVPTDIFGGMVLVEE